MSSEIRAAAAVHDGYGTIVAVAFLGAFLIFIAGLAQSDTLHDAAHDLRHTTGFPCH